MESNVPKMDVDPITLTRWLIQEQSKVKTATGDFTILLSSICTACKFIADKVHKAGISNLYGLAGSGNTSGDD